MRLEIKYSALVIKKNLLSNLTRILNTNIFGFKPKRCHKKSIEIDFLFTISAKKLTDKKKLRFKYKKNRKNQVFDPNPTFILEHMEHRDMIF